MNYTYTLIYPNNYQPISVSELLQQLLVPRKWRHLLRINKSVTINGKYRNFNEVVFPGDSIQLKLNFIESHQQQYPASGSLPDIIYEDSDLLIINKKPGQKTHPNLFETDTALNDCATYLSASPFIVHRLDMLTRGLLLVAKNPAVVPSLNRQLITKNFKRDYLAIVANPHKLLSQGTISFPIAQDPTDQRKRCIAPNGLKAITHYQILQKDATQTLIKLSLETGRTHQIRVHLAAIGCPIIGDPLYNQEFREGDELQLQAYQISLTKPFTFKELKVALPKSQRLDQVNKK